MTTGQRIAACRKERGLSQEELGAQLGVPRQSIYKWESDASFPEVEKLVALSRLFGVSVGWLLGVEEERTPSGSASDALNETQLIGEYTSLYTNSLPASNYSLYDDRIMLTEVSSTGKVTLNNIYFTLILDAFPVESAAVNSANQQATTASLRVGLFLNQKLVAWAQPCSQPAGYTGDYNADFYALPNMKLTLKESDRLATAVVATDNYGRCVVYPSAPYQWCKETSDLRWSDDHYDSPSDSDDWSF